MSKSKKLTKKLTAFAASAVMAVSSVGGAVVNSLSTSAADLELDNYAKLLQYSLYFFDANYCGEGAGEKSHFSWRDDCHTNDVVPYGFHDAGDGIICGLTEGFSASTLGWMYYEYADQFKATGTDVHLKDITDEFARFMKASTTLDSDGNVTNFVYEIGDDGKDHGKWRAPELMDSRLADETYSTTNGASNVAAQYAAALAQNYINFGNEEDLKYAVALYNFAAKYRTMTYEQSTYSDKSVEDDIAWAAGWLYLATNEQPYLDANSKDTSGTNDWINDYYYGGVWLGAAIINAEITGNWTAPVNYIQSKTGNSSEFYYADSWGSARYNTLMQMCALVATKHNAESGADFSEWCKGQMNMVLGDNNANVCLVVGYNDVSATSPHHRAASGLYVDDSWSQWNDWDGNYANVEGSHTLYGALCGGPTSHTDFSTFRKLDAKDATSNEVALDYQVGLVGAAAGLYAAFGTGNVVAEIGSEVTVYPSEIAIANGEAPAETTTEPTETTTEPVETTTDTSVETTTTSTDDVTETTTTIAKEDEEDNTYTGVYANAYLAGSIGANGQWSATEAAANGTVAEVDGNGTYEVEWKLAEGSETISFLMLEIESIEDFDSYFTTDTFPDLSLSIDHFYIDGNEVELADNPNAINLRYFEGTGKTRAYFVANWGANNGEDFGVGEDTTVLESIKVVFTVGGTYQESGEEDYIAGDANSDGKVSLADAVTILQNLANSEKYPMTDTQKKAADVDGVAGVTGNDALTIQRYDSGNVDKLPLA